MEVEELSASLPSERRLSVTPPQLRRRFSERHQIVDVDTIMEETDEEEKQEIEPCNYENLFETVGEYCFYRRRARRGFQNLPASLDPTNSVASFVIPHNNVSSPALAERREEEDRDNDQDICPQSLSADNNSLHQEYQESSSKSLAWPQFKAILSKNFKLYNSVDIYILASLIIIGMLIIPYQFSFVKENEPKSYHYWNLKFPDSFGFLKSQSTDFWVKLLTGYDSRGQEPPLQVVDEMHGLNITDILYGHGDEGGATTGVSHEESPRKHAKQSFQQFENDMVKAARRLLRHPIPTPTFGQYVRIHNMVTVAKDHFNQTKTPLGTLHIAPPFPDFQDYLQELYPSICYDTRYSDCDVLIRVHGNSSAALDFIFEDIEPTWALLDFTNWDKKEYVIRMDPSELPSTPLGETVLPTSDEYQLYFTSGFLTLQKTIDEYAFVVADRTADDNCYRKALRQTVVSMPMPIVAFARNTYLSAYGFLIGLACIAALLAPIARLVLAMVSEKEAKLQSMIVVAGVRGWLINLSWLAFAMLQCIAVSLSVAVLLKLSLLSHITCWKLAIWMVCSGLSAASFSFATGIVFEQATISAALAPALFLATALPRFIVFGIKRDTESFHHWVALFPGSAICFGVDSFVSKDNEGKPEELLHLFRVIAYLVLDSVAAIAIGFLYASANVSSEIERCMASLGVRNVSDDGSIASNASTNTPVSVRTRRSFHQSLPSESTCPMIYIQGLMMRFHRDRHPVLNGIDFMFNRGEITALLGHNGAGKTTLAWVMAGLQKPTSGDCFIHGRSLHAASSHHVGVGFCPQKNILYDKLTVYQHLELFAKLHGARHDANSIERRARAVGLSNNLHAHVQILSQGNKRKVSFAIARYGRRFGALILDEPMAGQDFDSRKLCWSCLQKDKESCAVIIATHNIKETEQRADRVIIMKDGSFHASGSPHFLKQRFQLPCTLTIVTDPRKREIFKKTGSAFLLSFQGLDAKLVNAIGNMYMYQIPQESMLTIPTILDSLDRFVQAKIVLSIKVETASLSELFRMIFEDEDVFSTNSTAASTTECDDSDQLYETRANAKANSVIIDVPWITQVVLMCWKRWQIRKRLVFGMVRELLIFAALVALSLGVLAVPTFHNDQSIILSPAFSNPDKDSFLHIGGGATLTNPYTSDQIMVDKLEAIKEVMASDETPVNVSWFPSVRNSSAMSRSLSRQRDTNILGAFVLFDILPVRWDVNWPYYHKYLLQVQATYKATVGNWSLTQDAEAYDVLFREATGGYTDLDPVIVMVFRIFEVAKEYLDVLVQSELERKRPRLNGTSSILISASILHNTSSPHAVAQYTKAYYDSLFYECSKEHPFRAISHPLSSQYSKNEQIKVVQSVLATLFLLIPLCSIAGTIVVFHTEERSRKASFTQVLSGMHLSAFWVANVLSDLLPMGLVPFIVLAVTSCYAEKAPMFVGGLEQVVCTFALLSGYCLSVIPFSYLISRKFVCTFAAQFFVTVILFATGLVPLTMIYTIETISAESIPFGSLIWLFRACPSFALGEGLIELCKYQWLQRYRELHSSPMDNAVSGNALKALFGSIVPFFACFLFLEKYGDLVSLMKAREWLASCYVTPPSRSDPTTKQRLRSDTVVQVEAATKVYVRSIPCIFSNELVSLWKHAVQLCRLYIFSLLARDLPEILGKQVCIPKLVLEAITFSVKRGETLVIVGASGEGKSTLLEIIGGYISPSRGRVRIMRDLLLKKSPLKRGIGYCPQADPFWDELTGRETLVLYGRICGIPQTCVNVQASRVLSCIDLQHQADTVTKQYCGGDRRKLALGISLIGDPVILLIDECCSGIDPLSSLRIWKAMSDASKDAGVIFATHNFQEAEALCMDIATLSSGRLRFQEESTPNFLVEIYFSATARQNSEDLALVRRAIDDDFPGHILVDVSASMLSFFWRAPNHQKAGDVVRLLQSMVLSLLFVEGFRLCQGGIQVANLSGYDDNRERLEI